VIVTHKDHRNFYETKPGHGYGEGDGSNDLMPSPWADRIRGRAGRGCTTFGSACRGRTSGRPLAVLPGMKMDSVAEGSMPGQPVMDASRTRSGLVLAAVFGVLETVCRNMDVLPCARRRFSFTCGGGAVRLLHPKSADCRRTMSGGRCVRKK
jgi:hypothetical protein